MAVINLFSHALYYEDLNLPLDVRQTMLEYLDKRFKITDNDCFLQSSGSLCDIDEFQLLKKTFENNASAFWNDLGYAKREMCTTQMWANYMGGKGFINDHFHSNSLVSGVYYLYVEEGSGNTGFSDPMNGSQRMISVPVEKYTEYTMEKFFVNAVSDRLVLFPSYLNHWSEPNQENSARITISFNCLPTELGEGKTLNYVKIK